MNKKQGNSYQKQQYIKTSDTNISKNNLSTFQQSDKIKKLYEKLNAFQKSYKTSNNVQQDYKKYESTNTQTNLISLNSSNSTLSYEAVKQKSYLDNKGFQIFEDVNLNTFQPVQSNNKINQKIKSNLHYILNLIKQFRQIKQQIKFQIQQQRIQFFCIFQEIFTCFYQYQQNKINDKIQKSSNEFDFIKESLDLSIKSSQKFQNRQQQSHKCKDLKLKQLKQYCAKLEQQKINNQKKFQQTLKSYQSQIQIIKNELQKKFSSLRSCKNCINYKDQLQKLNIQQQQLKKCKKTIKNLEQNHKNVVIKLEQQIIQLQQQFQLLGRRENENKQKLKDKQKQIFLRQSQVQYRFKLLQQKQKQLDYQKECLQNLKHSLDFKRQKIMSYEVQLKRQRTFQMKQEQQRNLMKSQYFSSIEKKGILRKYQNENHSRSSLSKNNDINQRIKQLKTLKNKVIKDSIHFHSRNNSKDSQYFISNGSIRGDNYNQASIKIISPLKNNSTNSTIRLNQKLEKLSLSLKRDLQEIK